MVYKHLLLLALLSCTAGCPTPEPEPEPDPLARKVMFLGIDGLRGDGISGAETPAMDSLIDGGAWTFEASTHLRAPTVSGPGWASILTGVEADKHLIYANGGYDQFDRMYPTFVGRAHDLGFSTGGSIHWLPIQVNLMEDGALDESTPVSDDALVAEGMAGLVTDFDLAVHFVHLDDVDGAGHSTGFTTENPDYVAAVEATDGYIGQILDAVEARPTRDQEEWLFVLTSDHGGDGTSHGALNEECRTIPLLVAGDAVTPGELTADGVSHLDVHPTVMTYLGHPPEDSWALDGEARAVAVSAP